MGRWVALAVSLVLPACFESHGVAGARADGGGPCTVSRCGVWIAIRWRADVEPGVITRLRVRTDLRCEGEDVAIIGPLVDPRAGSQHARLQVCDGCHYVEAVAEDATGRMIAAGRTSFCIEGDADVWVELR